MFLAYSTFNLLNITEFFLFNIDSQFIESNKHNDSVLKYTSPFSIAFNLFKLSVLSDLLVIINEYLLNLFYTIYIL